MEKLNFARNSELSMQVFTDEESDNEVNHEGAEESEEEAEEVG